MVAKLNIIYRYVLYVGVMGALMLAGVLAPSRMIPHHMAWWGILLTAFVITFIIEYRTEVIYRDSKQGMTTSRMNFAGLLLGAVAVVYGLVPAIEVSLVADLSVSVFRMLIAYLYVHRTPRWVTWSIAWFHEDPTRLKIPRILNVTPKNIIIDIATLTLGLGVWKILGIVGMPSITGFAIRASLGTTGGHFLLALIHLLLTLWILETGNLLVFLMIMRVPVLDWKMELTDYIMKDFGYLILVLESPLVVPLVIIMYYTSVFGFVAFALLLWRFQSNLSVHQTIIDQATELQIQQKSALTDFLSGLPNRRAMEEYTSQLMEQQIPVLVAMIDGDNFKRVNDTWGHEAGDFIIQAISKHLVSRCRTQAAQWPDMVARWGGEEFVILIPHCPWTVGDRKLNDIRDSMAASPFVWKDSTPIAMTISIGASIWTPHCGHSITEILEKEADHAVYQAKELGRNRVVMAPEGADRWQAWSLQQSDLSSSS